MSPVASPSIEAPVPLPTFERRASNALDALQSCLNDLSANPADCSTLERVASAVASATRALAELPRRELNEDLVERTLQLSAVLRTAGVFEVFDRAELDAMVSESAGWGGTLALMLAGPAWRWPKAPLFGAVPDRMWGAYAAWLFASPTRFADAADSDAYAAHLLRHLQELNRWMKRNAGSAAVRAAAESFVHASGLLPLQLMRSDVCRLAALRGDFLARYFSEGSARRANALVPRLGRRMRIGFVHSRFGPGADLRAVLPGYAELDSRNFETILISLSKDDAEFANASRGSARECFAFPAGSPNQLTEIRALSCDVLVFCGDVGTRLDDLTRLASQRLAPLQVADYRSGMTSGLPEMDLYVIGDRSDALEIAGEFTERLGLLRGPALSFAIPASSGETEGEDPREALGLPAGVTLFASVVTAAGVSPETFAVWSRVLAQSQDSRLVIARVPDELESDASSAVTSFCNALGCVLNAHGVASNRVSVFPVAAEGVDEVRTLLRTADVYLESLSGFAPVWMAEALTLGRAGIAMAAGVSTRHSGGAELLTSLDAGELIARDADAYVQLAVKLAADTEARSSVVTRLKATVDLGGGFLDLLAAGDAFGALLETAFDELAALGHAQFRVQREPLRCFAPESVAETIAAGEAALANGDYEMAAAEATLAIRAEPLNVAARVLRGRVLLAEGDASRAVTYLLAAVERRSDDAELWFTLAGALRQNQQTLEAVQALETSLRLDRMRIDGWLMLIEMAESAGAVGIARDALDVLREIAPDDPRVLAMI